MNRSVRKLALLTVMGTTSALVQGAEKANFYTDGANFYTDQGTPRKSAATAPKKETRRTESAESNEQQTAPVKPTATPKPHTVLAKPTATPKPQTARPQSQPDKTRENDVADRNKDKKDAEEKDSGKDKKKKDVADKDSLKDKEVAEKDQEKESDRKAPKAPVALRTPKSVPQTQTQTPPVTQISSSPSPTTRTLSQSRPAPSKDTAPARSPATIRRATTRGLDPYGLSAVFSQRWDLLHFVINSEEALRYRIASAHARAARLAKSVSKLTAAIERREKNLRNAAVAAYFLGQANSNPAYLGNDVTLPHFLMVEATLRRDGEQLQRELTVYEILRSEENRSAERKRLLEKKAEAAPGRALGDLDGAAGNEFSVSESPGEEYRRLTEALVHERGLDRDTEEAVRSADRMAAASWKRETLASLAPAPPDTPPEGFGAPAETGNARRPAAQTAGRKETSEGDEPDRPEENAVVIRTGPDHLVRSAADGTVVFAGPYRGVGNLVIVEHARGLFSVYENLASVRVGNGQAVRAGQPVGESEKADDSGEGWVRFQVRRGVEVVPPGELLGNMEAASVVAKQR